MGRAYGVICRVCERRLTVLESDGRVGIAPSTRDGSGPIDPDATLPVSMDLPDAWPPCPACGEFALRHDPNSTDLLLAVDPPVKRRDSGNRRRRSDPLQAAPLEAVAAASDAEVDVQHDERPHDDGEQRREEPRQRPEVLEEVVVGGDE